MGLDRDNTNKGYLIGRLIALVEAVANVPEQFASKCITNPLQKLSPFLRDGLSDGGEAIDVYSRIGDLPGFLTAEDACRAWIGYHHQRGAMASEEIRSQIGQRIAELRKQRGMSQAQLAEAAGIRQQSLGRIELGKHAQRLDVLARIASALGTRIDLIEDGQ